MNLNIIVIFLSNSRGNLKIYQFNLKKIDLLEVKEVNLTQKKLEFTITSNIETNKLQFIIFIWNNTKNSFVHLKFFYSVNIVLILLKCHFYYA
jgi:hypothetical protein